MIIQKLLKKVSQLILIMEKAIIDLLDKYDLSYVFIPKESLKNIYELLTDNKKFKPKIDIEILYIGVYWRVKNNYLKSIKYYKIASDLKNITSMLNLGCHYNKILFFGNANKYYLMAITTISNNFINCKIQMLNLDDTIKYYSMTFEIDHNHLINNFINHTELSKFSDVIKRHLVGIRKEGILLLNNLACSYTAQHYKSIKI